MRAGWNKQLRDWLWATDPKAALMVEAVTVEAEDVKDLPSEWAAADSMTGLQAVDRGGIQLVSTPVMQMDYSVAPDTNITTLAPTDPHTVIFIEWAVAAENDAQIENVTLKVHPKIGAGAREVTKWVCRAYQVYAIGPAASRIEVQYIGEQFVTESGNVAHDITFNFVQDGRGALIGGPPYRLTDLLGRTSEALPSGWPITMIELAAYTADGEVAGNCGLRAKAAAGPVQTAADWSARVQLIGSVDTFEGAESNAGTGGAWFKGASGADFPYIQINRASYAQASAAFTSGNLIDLGHAPTADVVVIAQGEEESDSSLLWEISDDGGANWYECADGDLVGQNNTDSGNDLTAVAVQQTYALRVTLTPSSSGLKTPVARRFGVEEVTSTDLGGAAVIENYSCGVDPVTLKAEIAQPTIRIVKTGERDYRDYFTQIMSSHHIGQVQMRVWVGHPDLARRYWLHIDTFDVEDLIPGDSQGTVLCLSVLGRLRASGKIPRFNTITNKRTPIEFTGATIPDAYNELLDTHIALPARLIGPGIPTSVTDTVSKFIRESDGKDELDRVAYLAGYSPIASQGRIKAVQMMDEEGDERPRVAFFPREMLKPINLSPGFTRRIDEYVVKTGWDETAGEWLGTECYAAWVVGLDEKLRSRGIESRGELDDDTCKWIEEAPSNPLGNKVAVRVVKHFSSGMILWEVESTYPHPFLEPGDVGVWETDQFVARSPITDDPVRGVISAKGTVAQVLDPMGRRFVVWIKSFADIVATPVSITRFGFMRPSIQQGRLEFGADGSLIGHFQGNSGVGSIRAVDDGAAFQSEATTRAATAVAVDADGWVAITLAPAGTYDLLDYAYVTAFAYESATGGGAESPVLFKLKAQQQDDADIDAELTGHGIGFRDDGTVVFSWVGDKDWVKGYANVGLGSSPADPTSGSKHGTLTGRSGSLAFDGSGGTTAKVAEMGVEVYVKVVGENSLGTVYGTVFGPFRRVRGDVTKTRPKIFVSAVRTSTSIDITVSIDDPTLAVSAIEYKKREGTGSLDGSWQTGWTSSSGTIGVNSTLSRVKTVSADDGLDGEFQWRVEYEDENGNSKIVGETINFSNLRDLTKTIRIPYAAFVPNDYLTEWVMGSTEMTVNPGIGAQSFRAGLTLPRGTEITEVKARSYTSADGIFRAGVYRNVDDGSGPAGTVSDSGNISSAGFNTDTQACSETVGTAAYTILAVMTSAVLPGDCLFHWVQVEYDVPSYEFTL